MTSEEFDKLSSEVSPRKILEEAVDCFIFKCEERQQVCSAEYNHREYELMKLKIERAELLKLFFK